MFKQIIRKSIEDAITKLKFDVVDFVVEHPENEVFGDYSTNVAFILSKTLKSPPMKIAEDIVKNIKIISPIEKVVIEKPGFINFQLEKLALIKELEEIVKTGKKYGSSDFPKGQKWLIEHTSPNPNKAMHLGHLRNNVLGMALSNIWKFMGITVIRDCVDNDRGIAIAKLMWGYLKFAKKDGKEFSDISYWYQHKNEWNTPEELNIRPDKFVDELYSKGSKDFEEREDSETVVREMVVKWENEDSTVWELWKTVLDFAHTGQDLTLKRLGSSWDKVWRESEHYKEGKELVLEGLKKGVFKKLEDGAILSDLEKYDMPDTILIKKDGTSLYITQDLALTKLKKQVFKPDKMFWVVGPDQSLALKQLFAICEQLKIGKIKELTHLSYGYMRIQGAGKMISKMSSRLGNVVYIDDLIDSAKEEVFKKTSDKDVAEKIALGAIKYSILKVGRTTDTVFDFKTSLSFEGDSGPYLQYTYARCKSILKNAKPGKNLGTLNVINKEEEKILKHIYKFPEVVEMAGLEYSPNLICTFLFELAKDYNVFYTKHSVLKAELEEQKQFRVFLTTAVSQIITNGLSLLGIESPEKM
ncbi:MAG: arginine--tRNA ligase [bacterium]